MNNIPSQSYPAILLLQSAECNITRYGRDIRQAEDGVGGAAMCVWLRVVVLSGVKGKEGSWRGEVVAESGEERN